MAVVLADTPPGVLLVSLEGENDAYDAARLREELDSAGERAVPVVVDLGRATFVDSTVVGVLLEVARGPRKFAILLPESAGEDVKRLFEITGLDAILPLFQSREVALATVRQ